MRSRSTVKRIVCGFLAAMLFSGTITPHMSAFAVTKDEPKNADGTTPNWNKPQDTLNDDQRQLDNQGVRLLVSKIKTSVGSHEGIAPLNTSAAQEDTITYKISGRVEGTISDLEAKYGTDNIEFAFSSAGIYLGYGWHKGTLEYLLNRKAAAYPEDLDFEIIYIGGVFSGYAYVTRKLATTDNDNRFVAGATMALYEAIEITRDNTITTDGKDVGEDNRFVGVTVTRNSDSTINDIRVKQGYAGYETVYVYRKDDEDKITVDSYGNIINDNYDPTDAIDDTGEGEWLMKAVQRNDTPILYYSLDNLRITSNDSYTDTTVDKIFGSERKDKDATLYAFDKERNVIDATQYDEIDFSIYGFIGDDTKPAFEFVGGDYKEIKYSESEQRIVVGKDTLIYHLDSNGNRDSLVDPQTGIAYIEEKIDKTEGHDNIHSLNNTENETQKDTKIYVWPVNITYDGSGSSSVGGSKSFSKIMATRIATINADTENEYVTGSYDGTNFNHMLTPMLDLYGRTVYYKQSSETYVKGEDTWDYDGDVYTGWKYTDILDAQNLNAYTINDHDTLYNGDSDDPFDQGTHYQFSSTQSVKLTVDSNGYIVNGKYSVPVPEKDGYSFKGWIVSDVTTLADGADVYPSWDSNPKKTMSDDMKNRWYSDKAATGTTKTVTVTFHANSAGDGDDGPAEFTSGSGDIHSTDNKLYRKLGESFLIYDKWVTGENTPNDPFDTTLIDTVENTASGTNTLTAAGKTANDPYSDTMSGGMSDMLKRVALGDYIMEEVSAPLGYVTSMPVGVTVNFSSEVQRTEMEDKTIKLELVKVDAPDKALNSYQLYVDGTLKTTSAGEAEKYSEHKAAFTYKEVTGAILAITGADKASKGDLSAWAKATSHPRVTTKTDGEGYTYIEVALDTPLVLEGFPQGSYIATEVVTPKGAVTMQPTAFTVEDEDSVQFKDFSDDHMKVEIEKYYLDDYESLQHLDNARRAQLALVDENGSIVSTWWTDDLSAYKSSSTSQTNNSGLLSSILGFFGLGSGSVSASADGFETKFQEAYKADKNVEAVGWDVIRKAELLSGATPTTQVWLLSDGTKVTCNSYSAPDDAPEGFKTAYAQIDSETTEFNYTETLTATKDTARTLTDSDMYWNCSNGSVIHIAAYTNGASGSTKYTFEFEYNYKDLSAYSENLVSYDKEEGVHRFDYLPKGNYTIRELTAPDGYVKAADKTITVTETSDIQRFMYENKQRDLSIAKYGLVNGSYYAGNDSGNTQLTDEITKAAVIPGFKFEVYYSENQITGYETAFSGSSVPAGAVLKDSFTTGTDGKYTETDYKNFIVLSDKIGDYKPHTIKDVENGYYYIVERSAPAGYSLSGVVETAVTDTAAETAMKITVVDEVIPVKIKVVKENENGNKLAGAGFTVTNKTLGGTTVGYLETDATGEGSLVIAQPYAFNADGTLNPYTFEISETKAPDTYELSDKLYTFTADPATIENGVSLISISGGTIKYVDTPTVISITKADFDTLGEVPGTGFTVYEAEYDAVSGKWSATSTTKADWTWETSAGHPEHQLNELAAGKTYALVETKVPAGYTKAETIYFTINNKGTAIEKTWSGDNGGHAVTLNMTSTGAVKSVTFKSRQLLGATLTGTNLATNATFDTGLDNSGYVTLTSEQLAGGGNFRLDIKLTYSDGTSEVLASTDITASASDATTKVKLPVIVNDTNAVSYTVTDEDGEKVASWTIDSAAATAASEYTVNNPLSGDGSAMTHVAGTNFVGQDSSAVRANKNIAYSVDYTGDGVNDTEILIAKDEKLTYNKIDGGSAAAYGPLSDGYYHFTGDKDGGTFTIVASAKKDMTGYVAMRVIVNGRTLERINPIAVNKDKSTTSFGKLVIANEVNGTDTSNDTAEFTYKLTLTKSGTDNALSGSYDWRTKSTSGAFDAFGKNKTFTFTLKGNDFLVIDVPFKADYTVEQISAETGFTTTIAGEQSGSTSTDDYAISYATFKNERSVASDRTVFKKDSSYIVTETLKLSDDDTRDLTKFGFTLNENDAAYNLIVLNKPTEVWFSKTDWTTSEEVPGATCKLYEMSPAGEWTPVVLEGVELTWTSTAEPKKFKGQLTAGKTYRYVEEGAPDGYAYTEAVEFTVSEDGRIDKVIMRDKATSVSFTKTDFAGEEVPGAKVSLKGYYVNDAPASVETAGGEWREIENWISTDDCVVNPHVIEGKLTTGATYRYHEEAAPEGYYYSEDIEFTLDKDGKVKDAHYINEEGVRLLIDADGYPMDDVTVTYTSGNAEYSYHGTAATESGGALYIGGVKVAGTDGFATEIPVINNVIQMKDGITEATFTKKDFAGNEVPGASMELKHYDESTGTWASIDTWTSEKTDKTAGTANAHEIKGKLTSGEKYRYHEEAAPEGYYYSEDIEFTVDKKGNITDAHYVNGDGETIAYDKNGYPLEVVTVKTNADGSRTFYYEGEEVVEDGGTLKKGDLVLITGVQVDIPVKNNVVQMLDAPIKVKLTKYREGTSKTIKLSGGVFNIVKKSDGSVVKSDFKINETLDLTKELKAGVVYLLREVTPPTGFKKADDVEFTVPTYNTDEVILVDMEDPRSGLTPSYVMEKVRVTDAPEKLTSGTYGFYNGDSVSYKVTIKNTGDMALTMTVADAFGYDDETAATTTLKSYFTKPAASDAVFFEYDKDTDAKGIENSSMGSTVAKNTDGSTTITLKVGAMAEIVYTAKVKDITPQLLAPKAADDKTIDTDGYRNTATVKDVTATPEDKKPGDKDTYDKDDFPELDDKKDEADTPVQVLVPKYEMEKERVSLAPQKSGTEKYGFYRHSQVDYDVTIRNTGEMALTMDVTDKFDDAISSYFTVPYVKAVKFYKADGTLDLTMGSIYSYADDVTDASGTVIGKNKVNIGIKVGGYAVVTYRATVTKDALESLSDAAADDGLGYLNTAKTTNVIGKYRDSKGTEHTVDKTAEYPVDPMNPEGTKYNPLEDKEDTANTPVQIPKEKTPDYTLTKRRIDDAKLKGGTADKYGFDRGDKVTYEVVVTNTGELPIVTYVEDAFESSVKKYFNELQIESVTFKVTADDTAGSGDLIVESGTGIGYTKAKIRVPVGQKAVIIYSAIVANSAPENLSLSAPDDGNGYLNIAKTTEPHGEKPETPTEPEEDIPLKPKEDEAHTPVKVPVPGYEMEKERVTAAPQKSGTTKYGFYHGDTVTYKVTITNTKDMDLQMLVGDSFTEHPEYFSEPVVDSVKFYKTGEAAESSSYGSVIAKDGTGTGKQTVYISLKIGGTAEVYYTAKVLDGAAEYLAPAAADNKAVDTDGYTNVATTTEVIGKYTDASGTHTVDKNSKYPVDPSDPDGTKYNPLEDKSDDADTPVQVTKVLTPRYTMVKNRITEAPEKTGTDKYGFKIGDTVKYEIIVTNTGDMPITTHVTDEFEASAKTYFKDLAITSVKFFDAAGTESASAGHEVAAGSVTTYVGSDAADIYVSVGCKAVVTYKATVTDKAVELLSSYKNEDDFGYVNTAKTTNTQGKPDEGTDIPLPPKEDEEKTPVQTPDPEYVMTKERVTLAPKKDGVDSKYGFYHGDIVTYKVTVTNKGSMQLTMDVEDHFDADVEANFTLPEFVSADFYLANGLQSESAGKKNSSADNTANITIEAECSAVLLFKATVLDTAPEYLAGNAADDRRKRDDGYGNTATTANVIAKYIDTEGVEHTYTKDDYPDKLGDKHDEADTPVQEIPGTASYTMSKQRITDATAKEEEPGKYGFLPGEKVTYKIVVENTGTEKIQTLVSDEFDASIAHYFKDLKIEAPTGGSAIVITDSTGKADSTKGRVIDKGETGIGKDRVYIELEAGGRAEVYYTATVTSKAIELLASAPDSATDSTGYLNIARTTETVVPDEPDGPKELPDKEDEDHTPVQAPKPSYTMDKERVTSAPLKIDGEYGFKHKADVDYRVTVTNTGETTLEMDVDDAFNQGAEKYFTTPLITSADFTDGEMIDKAGAGIGTDHARIKLAPGGKAELIFRAKVLDSAPESLSLHAADDGLGYINTATTKNVESTYTKEGITRKTTKEDYPDDDNPLEDKEDTAHTPVQVPNPDYALEKSRVSLAPKKSGSRYGFYRGNTVTYEVVVTNTGAMDLEMMTGDAFDTAIAGYFEDLTITNVRFLKTATKAEDSAYGNLLTKEGTGIGTTKAYIALNIGGQAVITYTAKVSNTAKEKLSNAAVDDGLGYLNTATTTEVIGKYKDAEGNEITVDKDDFDTLRDKEDTANTPVQVTTGGGGGGGGDDTYARISIYKYDSESSKALAGAVFDIYYPDGSLYKTVTTGSTGGASVKIYSSGTYHYKEVKAPDGYALDDGMHDLVIEGTSTVKIKVANTTTPNVPKVDKPKGKITVSYNISLDADGNGYFDENGEFHKLPSVPKYKTGDESNMPLMMAAAMAGFMIITIGLVGLMKSRRKRR